MRRIAVYTIFSFVLMSMTSCFLFQTKENCPAYGEVQEENKTELNLTTEDTKA